jgi:hypothetical protein
LIGAADHPPNGERWIAWLTVRTAAPGTSSSLTQRYVSGDPYAEASNRVLDHIDEASPAPPSAARHNVCFPRQSGASPPAGSTPEPSLGGATGFGPVCR